MMLTTAQAAEILGISARQVRHLCKEGQIIATKFGHVWGIAPEDLDEFAKVPRRTGPKKRIKDTSSVVGAPPTPVGMAWRD
jgi:excisionase family DNA binding protein